MLSSVDGHLFVVIDAEIDLLLLRLCGALLLCYFVLAYRRCERHLLWYSRVDLLTVLPVLLLSLLLYIALHLTVEGTDF